MADSVDYYAVLGVSRQANAAEITRAYRRALRRLHPDTGEHLTQDSEAPAVGAALALLHEAFAVLGDPERRAAHDRRSSPRPAPPARTSRPRRGDPYLTEPADPPLRAGPVHYRPSPPTGR